jgi:hypothetical protein
MLESMLDSTPTCLLGRCHVYMRRRGAQCKRGVKTSQEVGKLRVWLSVCTCVCVWVY